MRRREFIALVGGAGCWPLAAHAQQQPMPVIGFLHSSSRDSYGSQMRMFRESLKEGGYVEGQNVTIEYRWADDQIARLPALVAELLQRQVSVIVAGGSPASALAAKSATTTIPIVFMNAADPVEIGLVKSFNRPGGSITGATLLSAELVSKRLGILHDLLPSVKNVAVLVNPARPGIDVQKAQVQTAAQKLDMTLHIFEVGTEQDFDAAFRDVVSQHDGALVVTPDALFLDHRAEIADLAIQHKIPTVFELRNFVEAGGLISYGASPLEMYRQGGSLTAQILTGKKPADLPVLQPTKFELAINMKTARALGIEVPTSMQLLADEIIE
jgi:putative ABC transport system substrate-binding protein